MYPRLGALIVSALFFARISALAAPTPEQIIQKMNEGLARIKTYQGAFQTDMSMGSMGSISVRIDIKMIPKQKINFQIAPVGAGSGPLGQRAAMLRMQAIDDGATGWAYLPARNEYMKGPHSPAFAPLYSSYGIILDSMRPKPGSLSLLPNQHLGGSPVYVVAMNAGTSSQGGSMEGQMFIDQKTYRVKQVVMKGMNRGEPIRIKMVVKSEKINAPIPDSVFKFTPPKGAKQVQPPSAPGRGG